MELILKNDCSTISQKDILGHDAVNWKADKLSTVSCSEPTRKGLLGGDTSSLSLPHVAGRMPVYVPTGLGYHLVVRTS